MNARLQSGPSRSFLLTNWITASSSSAAVTQNAEDWLELPGFADATFYVEVSQVSNPTGGSVVLNLETAPFPEEGMFTAQPVAGPIVCAPSTAPYVAKTASGGRTPLCRFVRWRALGTTASAWSVTFRIRVVANRARYFAPTDLGGCAFWVRADIGLNFGGTTITSWADQSSNDVNKTLTAPGAPGTSTNPTWTSTDSHFANQPSVAFSGNAACYFTSGIWSSNLNQPDTWVLVGKLTSASTNYFINGNTTTFGFGQAVWATATTINASAGTALSQTTAWTTAGALMCEFNGGSSKLYALNSFSSVASSGNIGSSVVNALAFGANNTNFPPLDTWNGSIVEAMAFSGTLSSTQKQLLRQYLNNRYGLSIS